MKLIIVLMTTVFLQIGSAAEAQKISLSEKDTPLIEMFKEIRIQSGYDFFGDLQLLKAAKPVTIEIKNATIEEVLKICFANQNLDYVINSKIIVIKKKEDTLKTTRPVYLPQDSVIFKGKVLDEIGNPMPGATVKPKGSKKITKTGNNGDFSILASRKGTLEISFIGYVNKEISLRGLNPDNSISVTLNPSQNELSEVNIVSTGYQDIPKDRAPGSFEIISKEQLQHSNSPNLIRRLEGITTSMDFNNPNNGNANLSSGTRRSPLVGLTIRGKNTLQPPGFGADLSTNSGQILIVIDGVPSPYSIDQVNPDDVESINVLKDAAAASIWGSRASNGVIVIKTKKGSYNKPVTVSFNTNVNVSEKIDLFYKKPMSTSDFVDAQIQKYNTYHSIPVPDPTDLYVPQPYLSPVEEIINDQRLGQITEAEAKAKLDDLRDNDVRRDLDKYFLRPSLNQNYGLALDGGSQKYAYRLSGSYSNTRENTRPSSNDKYNLSYNVSLKLIKNLSVQAIVSYNESQSTDQPQQNRLVANPFYTGFNPYARLADDAGNPLVIPRNYRPKFLQLLANHYGDKILDMSFRPLDDMKQGYYKSANRNLNLNLNANYQINPIFNASLTYGYNYGQDEINLLNGANSFYTREWINIFTTREDYADPYTGIPMPLKKLIPLGGFYTTQFTKQNIQTLRGQLNADKTWNGKHQLNAFAVIDIGQFYSLMRTQQLYGYDDKTLKSNNSLPFGVEYNRLFSDPQSGLSSAIIPFFPGDLLGTKTRTLSFSSNAAYTYDNRYTLSASIRRDLSSTSGPTTNKGGTPYISVGGLWNLGHEKFYPFEWLPLLQLRATYGYNGNINSSVPSRPFINYVNAPSFGGNMLPYAATNYVSNSELRPERSKMLNLGLNFGFRGNRLTGSVEYFIRNTSDLINEGRLDPTSGYATAIYNIANLRSWGSDVTLNSVNLQTAMFRWTSNLTFTYNRVKILNLFNQNLPTADQFLSLANVEGYELSRIAAFRWAGLDPLTGDPRGYDSNGNILSIPSDPLSPNFTKISSVPVSSLRYFGSAVPVYYGALRNTFSYASFSLTAAFQYKLGYYFRKTPSDIILYDQLIQNNILGAAEFAKKWQNPGDEKNTNVPSLTFPTNENRDYFYRFSEINVLKADHIRLQEINLSYAFRKTNWFVKNPRIYANITNLGIIWRANKEGIDPDANDYPRPRTYGFGLSANF
jgi:TonB-linked SusC/RagA family outer membrane protein